jgi:hypothetical protein
MQFVYLYRVKKYFQKSLQDLKLFIALQYQSHLPSSSEKQRSLFPPEQPMYRNMSQQP